MRRAGGCDKMIARDGCILASEDSHWYQDRYQDRASDLEEVIQAEFLRSLFLPLRSGSHQTHDSWTAEGKVDWAKSMFTQVGHQAVQCTEDKILNHCILIAMHDFHWIGHVSWMMMHLLWILVIGKTLLEFEQILPCKVDSSHFEWSWELREFGLKSQ